MHAPDSPTPCAFSLGPDQGSVAPNTFPTRNGIRGTNRLSIRDIAHGALRGVDERKRERIWVALEEPGHRLDVDGELLSRSIGQLVERAVESGSPEILLRAHVESNGTLFAVVSRVSSGRRLHESSEDAASSLTRPIECVALLGGELTVQHTEAGHLRASILIPHGGRAGARS